MIEPKGCDAYAVKNHTRLFMASNNTWIVPAGMEERRFFVVKASNKYIQDTEYFGAIQRQMDRGGREGLLNYLQQYNLSGIDLTNFPRTAELANQKLLSMDLFERFWYATLQEGKLFVYSGDDNNPLRKVHWGDGVVRTDAFFQAFQAFIKDHPEKWFGGKEGFGIAIGKVVNDHSKKRIRGEMCYIFPPLQACRESFETRTKQKWDWPDSNDDADFYD